MRNKRNKTKKKGLLVFKKINDLLQTICIYYSTIVRFWYSLILLASFAGTKLVKSVQFSAILSCIVFRIGIRRSCWKRSRRVAIQKRTFLVLLKLKFVFLTLLFCLLFSKLSFFCTFLSSCNRRFNLLFLPIWVQYETYIVNW